MRRRHWFVLTIAASLVLGVACDSGQGAGGECGNGICEAGESFDSCPGDCTENCGNGVCDPDESSANCALDCPVCVVDGICDSLAGETPLNCADDCSCEIDGTCDVSAGENTFNCPADCPACNNDGVCDDLAGENSLNCAADCPICNGDGICDDAAGENGVNCPADCGPGECDLQTITPPNAPTDYVVRDFRIPTSTTEAQFIGIDMDGDGDIDNKLGQIMSLFSGQTGDPNVSVNFDIQEGALVLLGRLYIDQFPSDATVLGQIFQGEPTMAPPIFDGNDVFTIDPGFPTDIYLCGFVQGGQLGLGPGDLLVPFPLPDMPPIFVTVRQAQMVGTCTVDDWQDMMVGGGITRSEIDNVVVPALATYFNILIAQDPAGQTAVALMSIFDSGCSTAIPGCENVTPGTGDCSVNDPTVDPSPWLTDTELRCNALLDAAVQPDVDSDGDGTLDLLSLGIRVQAVRATIN